MARARYVSRREPSRPDPYAVALGLLAALLSVASCTAEAPAPERPNLILVSIDTLRADRVGVYGYPRPTTPELDRLASEAVVFTTAIAHAPTTLASHASILTSLLPAHHGASISRETSLSEGVTTLAEVLRDAGYRTASFNGGIQLDAVYGLNRGFDRYESVQPSSAGSKALADPANRMTIAVTRSLEWLDESEQPFFLFLHSYEIHHPYTPDAASLERFDSGYEGDLGPHIDVDLLQAINKGGRKLAEGDLQRIIDAYDAELRSVDDALGEFFEALRQRDLYRDSMIVVTSDHGEEFGEHGYVGWHSHSLFDELLLVPLIVKYPAGRHSGAVVSRQVRGIDVAPTSLGGLGLESPEAFAGVDLEGLLLDSEHPSLPALSMFDKRGAAVWTLREPTWKLLHRRKAALAFDLQANPTESLSRAERGTKRADRLESIGAKLLGERPEQQGEPVMPSAETTKQLRELGYIE